MEGNVWISLITYYFLQISLLDLNERHQDRTLTYISGGSKGGAKSAEAPPLQASNDSTYAYIQFSGSFTTNALVPLQLLHRFCC